MCDRIAITLNTCPKPVFAVDKRSVRDHVGILINRIKKKLRAEERSLGIAPPEPTELEFLVEEIVALEETADVEMKEDDENVKGKAEKEKAKATDMRLKALEKVSETMKRHSGENDQEKVKKRERRSDSETMLFLSKKAGKDQELKLEELQLKKEQRHLDAKRLQASIAQQRRFQQQHIEMMRLMQKQQQQQQQQQLLVSQQLMVRQQQDQTRAVMSLLDKLLNKSNSWYKYCWYNCRLILNCAITNQFVYFMNFCPCFGKGHDQRFLSAINVCISTVAPHFSCTAEPAFRFFL